MNRFLFLSMIYPRSYDRTRGTFCHATCKSLRELGHEVRVVSPRSWIECLRKGQPRDERLVREAGPTEYPCFYYPPGALQSTYGWWMWNSIKRSLMRIAKDFQPQAILSQWVDPDGTTAVRLGRHLQIPTGIVVGGSDVLLLTKDPRRKRVVARTLLQADAVFAVSRDLQEKTIALGIDPSKVHVVYRGVDESFCPGDQGAARERLRLPSDRKVLLWVGKMVPVKGLEVLLASLKEVVQKWPSALLVLVGDGPERKSLEKRVQQLGLASHVRFVGAVEPQDLPDWYRAADLTVLSSHSEGIPNVLRESLACGTPYVSTAVGGIAELSDHPAIRLVPPRNPSALAASICELLAAPQAIPSDLVERGWEGWSRQLIELLMSGERVSKNPRDTSLQLNSTFAEVP